MNSNNKKIIRNLLIYLGIPILLVVLLLLLFDRGADQTGLKYSDVLSYFEDGKVSASSLNLGTGEMKLTVTEDSSKKESVVRYTVPNVNLFYNDVSDYIKSYNEEHPNNRMTQDVIRPAETSWLVSLIPTLLMIALLVAFWVFMMKRMGGGVCATCSTKPRKTTRASSSSMKSMPWAASAVRVSAAATMNVSKR